MDEDADGVSGDDGNGKRDDINGDGVDADEGRDRDRSGTKGRRNHS